MGEESTTVEFVKAPLLMLYTKSRPYLVEGFRPGSHAQEMGVQVGWQISRVGEDDASTIRNIDQHFREVLLHLPRTRKVQGPAGEVEQVTQQDSRPSLPGTWTA